MACLRCGRKTEEGSVFCPECLDAMKEYPVKPGTVVQIPSQLAQPQPVKPPVRRKPTPEETIRKLKKKLRRLRWAFAVTVIVFGILAALSWFLQEEELPQYLPGQEYTAEQSSQETEAE